MLNSLYTNYEAFAKINLFLRVCGRRSDGFHEIQTLYQTVELADTVFFDSSEDDETRLEITEGQAPDYAKNLIGRAVELLKAECGGGIQPLRVKLAKRIPVGAGLGGGSSDGAATLVAVNQLFALGLAQARLERLAASLGSDVPLFIRGGAQLGTGRGEILRPVESIGPLNLVLVKPDVSISTAFAYSRFANQVLDPPLTAAEIEQRLEALRQRRWDEALENSFERVLSESFPVIRRLKNQLLELGCETALLSGSGSAVFGIATEAEAAAAIARRLRKGICLLAFDPCRGLRATANEKLSWNSGGELRY